MNEMLMMNAMLNRLVSVFDWLGYLFLIAMFIVAIWKPQRIYNYQAFRFSIILFGMNMLAPATVEMMWNGYNLVSGSPAPSNNFGGSRSSSAELQPMILTTAIAGNAARIMLAVSVALGLLSLVDPDQMRRGNGAMPLPKREEAKNAEPPAPHPLDMPTPQPPVRQTPIQQVPMPQPPIPQPQAIAPQPAVSPQPVPKAQPRAVAVAAKQKPTIGPPPG